MRMNQLGNTDIYLSVVGLGTYAMGGGEDKFSWGPQEDKNSLAAIDRALELGINWIDTAPVYGDGHAEEIVGQALKGRRDKVIISTKCGLRLNESKDDFVFDLSERNIRSEVEASLRRLKTDVIDLYQLHRPFPEAQLEEGWRTMADLVKEGKIRFAGVSTFTLDQLKFVQEIYPIKFLQPCYNMLMPDIEHGILDFCAANNIGVIVYSTMATGLLTGKFNKERIRNLPQNDLRHLLDYFQEPLLSANLLVVEKLRKIAERNRRSLAQLAIAWVLRRPEITSAIVGARKLSQIEQTAPAGDWVLSEQDKAELALILNPHQALLKKLQQQ